MLEEADPGDLQIVCNEYNVDTIPEEDTLEQEKVLEILKITNHPGYNPGTEEDFGPYIKGPFTGSDISVYHVNDANLTLEEGSFWPACLPRLESSSEDIFAGWMDPEPTYRVRGSSRVATLKTNYFLPRKSQVRKVSCADPTWMNSHTYYPPATICYKDPTESSCFQNGNSGSSVMTHFKASENGSDVDAYAFTGPLSMHKGCDQVRKDPSVWEDYLVLTKLILISFRHWC